MENEALNKEDRRDRKRKTPVALVTGAGSGIGRATALALVAAPWVELDIVTLTLLTRCVTIEFVIRTFRDRETERIFQRSGSRRFSREIQLIALRKLTMLDAAESLNDLRVPPGDRLEKLSGKRAGQYSIRINDQWRICFKWIDGNVDDVEIVDYH